MTPLPPLRDDLPPLVGLVALIVMDVVAIVLLPPIRAAAIVIAVAAGVVLVLYVMVRLRGGT